MDLGGRRALGIRSLPLWPLGGFWSLLGMGTRAVLGTAFLRARPGGLVWRAALWHWLRLWRRIRLWLWRRIRLVPVRIRRAILPVVPRQPGLFPQREYQQHADQ